MPNITQTADDLKQELREAIGLLVSAANAFDRGEEYQAKAMAVTLRVLVYDKHGAPGILKALFDATADAAFDKLVIRFVNTSMDPNPNNLLPHNYVMTAVSSTGITYVAPLDDRPPIVQTPAESFDSWWDTRIIFVDDNRATFTRRALVLGVANKGGGAHVDPNMPEALYNLLRRNPMGQMFITGKVGAETTADPTNQAAFPAVRQIVHEFLKTMFQVAPSYFSAPYRALSLSEREALRRTGG